MEKYSVTEASTLLSEIVDEALPPMWIEGEVSRFKRYPSGHCYFTIKDDESVLSAVIWSSYYSKMKIVPKEGEKALFLGKISVFAKRGQYQFTVYNTVTTGSGAINENLEQLKIKLKDEGVFDDSYKKTPLQIPQTIAIVSGKDSAALNDALTVLRNRAPYVRVKIFAATVQGDRAVSSICNTLKKVEEYSTHKEHIDTVLLIRGGGSVEDLWAFNSEKVVRAIFNMHIPVICGVGHDIDTTLTDYVSDVSAITPSVAAEKCAVNIDSIIATADYHVNSQREVLQKKIENFQLRFGYCMQSISTNTILSRFDTYSNRTESALMKIKQKMNNQYSRLRNRFELANQTIEILNPENIYKKGFAAIKSEKNGNFIKSKKNVQINDHIKVILADGEFSAIVTEK